MEIGASTHSAVCDETKAQTRSLAITLLATLCFGCAEPVPIDLSTVPLDSDETDYERLVDDAFGILGLPFEFTSRTRGTIHLAVVHIEGEPHGGVTTLVGPRCWKSVTANASAVAIAHEVAHALGLDHVCDGDECTADHADNLMNGTLAGGIELTDAQLEDLEDGRLRLTRCR